MTTNRAIPRSTLAASGPAPERTGRQSRLRRHVPSTVHLLSMALHRMWAARSPSTQARRRCRLVTGGLLLAVAGLAAGCGDAPGAPSSATTAMVIDLLGSTTVRPGSTPEQLQCIENTGATHVHPSWRSFSDVVMPPLGSDRFRIAFDDVPAGQKVQFTVWDPNWCGSGPIGYVSSGVSANGVPLAQNWQLEGQPGYELTVEVGGRVRQ